MKTGLVLSGGGVRGVAHIGAIKALEEYGIYPAYIAGTSAGAIVGALYAKGCNWEEMLDFFKTTQIFSFKNYARNKPGFLDTEKFYDRFKTYLPDDNFDSLKTPLYITATNLLDGTLKVFHRGELIKPLLASAAIPGVFAPVHINNGYYVDGGILNNFPVDLIQQRCDHIVGIYVNPFDKVQIDDLKHSYSIMERVYKIRMAKESLSKFENCDLLIVPKNLNNYRSLSMREMATIFNLGYNEAIQVLQANKNLLMKISE
ncbi:MAG: patatin-like phospholipase family protein [Pricia sp.]|nr:patatin-like phospholipase family protein [Pricia sp.]